MFVVEEGVMEKSTVYRKLERENKTEISSYRHIKDVDIYRTVCEFTSHYCYRVTKYISLSVS